MKTTVSPSHPSLAVCIRPSPILLVWCCQDLRHLTTRMPLPLTEPLKDGGSSPIPANRTIAAGGAFLRLVCVLQVVRFGTRTRNQEVVETAPALSLNVQEA